MNKIVIDRRRFLGVGAVAALLPMVGARGVFAADKAASIRHFWWGNPERDKRTFAVIDIFNGKHPDISVAGESLGFADYFTKLTTQIAGGNMPDVIQQGYGVLFEYISNGAVVPLDDYVGKTLDISKMDKSAIDAGTVNGKFYALSIGANSHMAMYNTRLYDAAGIKVGENFDPFGWTYDDVARIGKAVKDATGVPGTDDNTADYQNFSDFVGQKGVTMYSPEGEYQVTQEDRRGILEHLGRHPQRRRHPSGSGIGRSRRRFRPGAVGRSDRQVGNLLCLVEPVGRHPGADAGHARRRHVPEHAGHGARLDHASRASSSASPATSKNAGGGDHLYERLRQRPRHDRRARPGARHSLAVGGARGARAQADPGGGGVRRLLRRHPGQDRRAGPAAPVGSNEVEQTFERLAVAVLLGEKAIKTLPPTSSLRPRRSSRAPRLIVSGSSLPVRKQCPRGIRRFRAR